MADDSQTTAGATATTKSEPILKISEETREQFPDLIPLIQVSPSMNNDERQYWIDVLPIMTEDQIKNLHDILNNEKSQTDEANKAYAGNVEKEVNKVQHFFDEEAYRAKREAQKAAEKKAEEDEKSKEEAILKELERL